MGSRQDTALICLNGHVINSSSSYYPETNTKYCEKCGAEGITNCPSCEAIIRGEIHYDGVIGFDSFDAPSYCHNCGSAYPWTKVKLETLKEIIQLSGVDESDKQVFNENIEAIVSDTPKTNLAAMRIKNISTKLASGVWNDIAKPLIVDIASETAKKAMGL